MLILQDEFFGPCSGSLVRLVLLCAAIHQLVFTIFSTIPCGFARFCPSWERFCHVEVLLSDHRERNMM